MLELAGHEQFGNALDRRSQPLGCQFAPQQQGAFRDLAPTDRREHLAGPSRGEQLSLVQIHGQRLQVGTILDWCADRSGKAVQAGAVTGGATDGFDLMLLGQEANFRHIQDWTAFCDAAWDSAEVLTALAADLGTVTYHFIWLLYQRKRVPRVSLVLRGGRAVASWSHRFEGNRMVVKVAPFERGVLRPALYEGAFDGVGKLLGATSVEVDAATSSN